MEKKVREIVYSSNAPQPIGPYSQATRLRVADAEFLFLSGQIGINPATGEVAEGVEAQTRQVLTNIKAILDENGSGMGQVMKTTVFLKNMDDFTVMNGIYAEFFAGEAPARSAVEVARLPKDVLVEIEVIAYA